MGRQKERRFYLKSYLMTLVSEGLFQWTDPPAKIIRVVVDTVKMDVIIIGKDFAVAATMVGTQMVDRVLDKGVDMAKRAIGQALMDAANGLKR